MIGQNVYCNADIQEFYLTKWTSNIVPIYTSRNLIDSYSGIIDPWYQIKLNTAVITYLQTMNTKDPNGIFYNDVISIYIPKAENSKWKELVNILTDKYLIVFKDCNGNCFTAGYRFGILAKGYKLEENQYVIEFISPHSNNLTTSINCQWVLNNIINTPTPTPTPSTSGTPLPSITPSHTPAITPSIIIS